MECPNISVHGEHAPGPAILQREVILIADHVHGLYNGLCFKIEFEIVSNKWCLFIVNHIVVIRNFITNRDRSGQSLPAAFLFIENKFNAL